MSGALASWLGVKIRQVEPRLGFCRLVLNSVMSSQKCIDGLGSKKYDVKLSTPGMIS